MDNLNEILGKVTEFLKSETKTDTIIGEQFKLGEFTCVPVVAIGLGFGGGTGEGEVKTPKSVIENQGTGLGGGAGMGIGPVGFLVTKGDSIQFISIHTTKGLGTIFEKVPELLEKYLMMNKAKETTKETEKV